MRLFALAIGPESYRYIMHMYMYAWLILDPNPHGLNA